MFSSSGTTYNSKLFQVNVCCCCLVTKSCLTLYVGYIKARQSLFLSTLAKKIPEYLGRQA